MYSDKTTDANEQAKLNILDFMASNHKYDLDIARKEIEKSQSSYFHDNYKTEKEHKLRSMLNKCHILLLTANWIERGILHCMLYKQKIPTILSEEIAYYFFSWGKYRVVHVHQNDTGSFTQGGSQEILEKVLSLFTPNLVLSIGVAFGIDPKNQQIGNVLVSKRVLPYDNGTKRKDDSIVINNPQFVEIDAWLKCRFQYCQPFLHQKGVLYGDIVTGGSVISDPAVKDRILTAFQKIPNANIIGGEMEGAGVFKSCKNFGVSCVIVKGICDWGTMKNEILEDERENEVLKDCLQGYAMKQAIEACTILFDDENLFTGLKNKQKRQKKETVLVGLLSFFIMNTMLLLLCQKPIAEISSLNILIAVIVNGVVSLIFSTGIARLL